MIKQDVFFCLIFKINEFDDIFKTTSLESRGFAGEWDLAIHKIDVLLFLK